MMLPEAEYEQQEPEPELSPKTGDLIKLIGIAAVITCFAAAIFVGEGS